MKLPLALLITTAALFAAEVKLGKPLTVKEPVPLATLVAHADDYVGKTVQVKGKITAVWTATSSSPKTRPANSPSPKASSPGPN